MKIPDNNWWIKLMDKYGITIIITAFILFFLIPIGWFTMVKPLVEEAINSSKARCKIEDLRIGDKISVKDTTYTVEDINWYPSIKSGVIRFDE